jgi:hypothetical protein
MKIGRLGQPVSFADQKEASCQEAGLTQEEPPKDAGTTSTGERARLLRRLLEWVG